MSLHPLTNFEIQKYYQTEPTFNGVCSWNNLSKIKDDKSWWVWINSNLIVLYVNPENVKYFDTFRVKIFQKKLENSSEIQTLQQIPIKYGPMTQ